MASALPVFPPFSVHESAADQRWKKWTKRLQNLLVGMNIKDKVRQRALLLHYAGEEVNDIFDTLQETGEDYDTALTKLTEYFAPKKNVEYEIYKFRQAKQETNETMDAFHTKLRQLSVNCEFNDDNREVKSQIVQGCSSSRLRRKALREDMTLEQLLSSARALELSERQANEIENKEEKLETNALHKKRNFRKNQPRYLQQDKRPEQRVNDQRVNRNNKCRNCGGEFPHRGKCPAQGKSCNFCKKPNHFEKMCRSKRNNHTKQSVNTLENSDFENNFECQTKIDSSSDDEYVFGLQAESLKGTVNSIKREQPRICVKINESDINVLIDTGSSINVIDEDTYNRMKRKPKLIATKTKVFAYGSHQNLEFVGKFDTVIETRNKLTRATVYVSKGTSGNLLCYDTSLELQIIPQISRLSTGNKHEQLCEQYKDIFHGLGKLKETQVKIHVDKTVKPIVQPHRRIPFHIRKQVETELERLERLDIIERVHGPTPWVSPIVVAPKPKSPGEIRICVDMRLPNQAIQRERHITPTIDDLIVDLNGAKVFSKMDLLNGYHQLELTQESRNITTFTTHVGLRRYKRLSFGVTSAAEIFQNTLSTALEGLNGVRNISDDIIVFGASQDEHDTRLTALFQRINEKGLTLNKKKCEFNKDNLEFYGHIFSSKGISADPRKVEAIRNTNIPSDISEVRSFLAMTNYVGRFIPEYSTITEPLRRLTKQGVTWTWTSEQQQSFDALKQELMNNRIMAYFDPRKATVLIVDASPVGIGALLTQDGRVNAYASRALSDVEKRYSQTEREGLAIVWAIEHFHLYLYGHKFTLVTDHQPLECIFNNPKSKPPARIQRWRLRLQTYNFDVKYKSGKSNAADYMSRHPNINEANRTDHSEVAEEFVNYISENAIPKAMTIEEIALESEADMNIQYVIKAVKSGNWENSYDNKSLDTFARLKNELTTVNTDKGEILMHDNRIVIPHKLTDRVITLAHEGHQGIVRTKQLLREKVYFPGIDKRVEDTCKACIPCLAATPKKTYEPLAMSELPEAPWTYLSMDFCGPFPSGHYLMVIMDEYSRYPVVETLTTISAKAVIPLLDKVFSTFGIPNIVKTDNGSPWQGKEFRDFATYMGFTHRKITPLWPQSNAECERFMRSIGKSIRAAHTQHQNWKQEMFTFLRNYRATKHATTEVSPAKLLFGRNIKTKLPTLTQKYDDKEIRETDERKKDKMKDYADTRRNAEPSNLQIGDTVLVKQDKQNKLSTPYNSNPYKIVERNGTMLTAKRDNGHTITRNSSFYKQVKIPLTIVNEEKKREEPATQLRTSGRINKTPAYLNDYVKSCYVK